MTESKSPDELAAELGIDFDAVDPAKDLGELLAHLKDKRKITLEKSNDFLQQQAREAAKRAAAMIEQKFATRLTRRQRNILASIHAGVLVVKDLNGVVTDVLEILDLPTGWGGDLAGAVMRPRVFVTIHGMVMRPFVALIIRESTLADGKSERVLVHEILHLIGENNLPMLLMEALTDQYTIQVIGRDHEPELRMGWGYRLAYYCLNIIAQNMGTTVVWQAHVEEAMVHEIRDERTGSWVQAQLVDHPLHDGMRARMKRPADWDRFLRLVAKKHMIRAYLIMLFGIKR